MLSYLTSALGILNVVRPPGLTILVQNICNMRIPPFVSHALKTFISVNGCTQFCAALLWKGFYYTSYKRQIQQFKLCGEL